MKTLTSNLLGLFLVCLISISSCKKDETSDPDPINTAGTHEYLSGNLIEANFRGLIRNENDQPISDVEVRIGSSTTYTDADGFWQILGAMVDTERAYIRAAKAGYFHGSRVLTPSDIGFNRAFITLMTAQVAGSVSSEVGGEVSHSSGSMVSLPADGYVDENGNTYTGTLDVQISYLDPSNLDFLEQMPGNLTALEADGDFVALITYGIIAVELVGSGGESLQIAPGSTAEIHVAVPSAGMASAPVSIPLWYFDEENGVWKEDGTATLSGNEYVGEVSHFSFWNCDVPSDFVFLDGYVMGGDANLPIQGVQVVINSGGMGNGSAYTNQEGYFGGFIPANISLTMEVYSPCGDLLSSQEIGPFSAETSIQLPEIAEEEFSLVTGRLINCIGQPEAGFISSTQDFVISEGFEIGSDGIFNLIFLCPPQNIELTGFSSNYLTQSNTISVSTVAGQTIDLGDIDICSVTTDEYVLFTIDNDIEYTLIDEVTAFGNPSIGLTIQATTSSVDLNILYAMTMGDSADPELSSFAGGLQNYILINQTFYMLPSENPQLDFDFTNYGPDPGVYLEFTFTGTFLDGFSNPHEISGFGRVLRE